MIATIIIVGLAFGWLLWETEWLAIQLTCGVYNTEKRMPWEALKPFKIKRSDPFWLRFPEYMQPLCGLEWLENREHIIPGYRIVLVDSTSKYTMNVSPELDASILLKDVFRVYRNPYLKVRI